MSQEAQTNNDNHINEEDEDEEEFKSDDEEEFKSDDKEFKIDDEEFKSDDLQILAKIKRLNYEKEELKLIDRKKSRTEQIEELIAQFKPASSAAMVIIDDYQTYRDEPKEDLSFTSRPVYNDIFTWNVFITKFPPCSMLKKDMEKYKKKANDYHGIELRVLFPPDYPIHPPFIHVVRPRFQFHTGRVTVGGSLCMEILTLDKWKPISLLSLFTTIVTDIFAGDPRIDLDSDVPYSLEEAKEAYIRVAKDHGWTPSWIPE